MANNPDARPVKILVVDDSELMRRSLSMALSSQYTVQGAKDGMAGLEAYEDFRPEVILLDLNMPRMGGFEVIEKLRKDLDDQEVFIIVLTADDCRDVKPKALNLGANDFLYKPFERPELMARVGVAARQVRLTRQLHRSMSLISQEMDNVAALQAKLLPDRSPLIPGVSVNSLYKPSGLASGDYYDYFLTDSGALRVVMADVSGHGARAAFIMAIVRTLFRVTRNLPSDLTSTLRLINDELLQTIGREDDYVTVFAADIDFSLEKMKYINAGHCPGLLKDSAGNVERLAANVPLLGFFQVDISCQEIRFNPGSELFLYTDGFYEWSPQSGELLDPGMFLSSAGDLMARKGCTLEDIMHWLSGLSEGDPVFRDDLTALWVKTERRQ